MFNARSEDLATRRFCCLKVNVSFLGFLVIIVKFNISYQININISLSILVL